MWSISRCLSRIQVQSLLKSSTRQYMKASDKVEMLFKQADHVPFPYKLVYRHVKYRMGGLMYHAINFMGVVSASIIASHFYKHGFVITEDAPEVLKINEHPFQSAILITLAIGTIIFASKVRARYVLRIYYNEKEKMFKAIFHGRVPYTIEHYNFPAESMIHAKRNPSALFYDVSFNANGRKILLFEDQFKSQNYFEKMLHPAELEYRNM